MKLDQQYIERTEAIRRDTRAGIGLYGYVGNREIPEDDDFGDFLKRKGISYEERIISTVGTWEDKAHELHYRREEQGERYAYVLNFRYDIDYWGQSVYLFAQPVPDERLAETILLIRQQERDLNQLVSERQREIDKEYPPYWGLINYNWEMSIMAYYLVKHGWTSQAEKLLMQWGAYQFSTNDGIGLDNPLVQSLLAYGQLIMQQNDPDRYIQNLLESVGTHIHYRTYRELV